MKSQANFVFIERIFALYRKPVLDIIFSKRNFVFFHSVDKRTGIYQTKAAYSDLIKSFFYGRKDSRMFLFPFKKLFSIRPRIIIHEFSAGILSIPLVLLFCRLSNTKLIFWGHMYDRTKGFFPKKSISDKYRLWLWQRADCLIAISQADKKLLLNHGISEEKVFVSLNTVDTSTLLKIRDDLEKIGKEEIKRQLNLRHQFNLVFIGRLYREKRPELLLDIIIGLKKMGIESIAVHYIGDGEMNSTLKERVYELGLENDVFFHGAVYDDIKAGKILFGCDLMVIPGCVGLSVNHAFCFNCPVSTFQEVDHLPAHGPEIEYIINNRTGFLVPHHSIDTMIKTVKIFLESKELKNMMRCEIRNFIENECSVEKMALGVLSAIDHSLTIND